MSLEWERGKYKESDMTHWKAECKRGVYFVESIPNTLHFEVFFAGASDEDSGELGEYESLSAAQWACEKDRIGSS
jgi:hypothetical protein